MRCLERNKTPFYYCLYQGKVEILDDEGHRTGESKVQYSSPTLTKGNISPAKGTADVEQFGNSVSYDKQIVLEDKNCPINENSIIFIDVVPNTAKTNFNYIVVKVGKSLNHTSIAIRQINND